MDQLNFCRIRDVKPIQKAHETDAGFDFFVPKDFTPVEIEPHHDVLIPCGIKVFVPHGYALIGFNKSGIAVKFNLKLGACVIDEFFTNEVLIHLMNDGNKPVKIEPDMKIAQFVLVKIGNHLPKEISVDEYEKLTNVDNIRGLGGFGSTGI